MPSWWNYYRVIRRFLTAYPVSLYRSGKAVKTLKYGSALKAIGDGATKAEREPQDYALHSLRIGGAMVLAAGGDTPEVVIQGEGRWT